VVDLLLQPVNNVLRAVTGLKMANNVLVAATHPPLAVTPTAVVGLIVETVEATDRLKLLVTITPLDYLIYQAIIGLTFLIACQ
jgi:hypothetical protein